MAKKKQNKKRQNKSPIPSKPKVSGIPFAMSPNLFEIQKIKEQATAEAVKILQEKVERSDAELKRLQIEAYNEALDDALRYILVMGCRALNNKFGFGYIRLERFVDEIMFLIEEGDVNETEKWLKDVGLSLKLIPAEESKEGEYNGTD